MMMLNETNPSSPVTGNKDDLPMTEEFTCLESTVRYNSGAIKDIKKYIDKARNVSRMLNNVWRSSQYGTKTKLNLYQRCVVFTLLCGSQCWRITKSDPIKLSTTTTSIQYCACSGLRPSPFVNFSPNATTTTWRPSSCNDDGEGPIFLSTANRSTLPVQVSTEHLVSDCGSRCWLETVGSSSPLLLASVGYGQE